MPFLGQQPAEGYRSIAKQTITGNNGTSYTLDYKVTSANDIEVFVNNVRQEPGVAYTASGTTITFSDAITSSDSCYVVYQSRAVTSNLIESQNIASGAITLAKTNFYVSSSTEPSSPFAGQQWWSPTDYALRVYDGDTWQLVKSSFSATGGTITQANGYQIHTFTSSGTFTVTKGSTEIEYLVIAGGGSGGSYGGGGGSGGYRSSVNGEYSGGGAFAESKVAVSTGSYTVTIGAGGASRQGDNQSGYQGTNSAFGSVASIGGGGGAAGAGGSPTSGGSGGGGSYGRNAGGAGTSGQGYNGGTGSSPGSVTYLAGGGGGAGAAGSNSSGTVSGASGAGGTGIASAITGSSIYRAGGGGGGAPANGPYDSGQTPGAGGTGGGGAGALGNASATAGTANTGGGGGGSGYDNGYGASGAGGSGIVIIRYAI